MTNMQLSAEVIKELLSVGVREFCLCAGARNSPLIHYFDENKHLKSYHFFEERSAAFFALGRMAQTRHPVAVITTSGTASAELLPAAIEATYSSLPLIMVTADRPKSFRGTGAPQTIDQVGLFSYYIEACFDLDSVNSHISLKGLSWKKPVHINMCFKEPLLDDVVQRIEYPEKVDRVRFPEAFPLEMVDEITKFLSEHRPLVLLSTVPEKAKDSVLQFLKNLKAPIYAEGISNLRGHPDLKEVQILSGEKMLSYLLDNKICDSLLRIGGVPTVRLWRDLEDKKIDLPVLSLGYNHFTGLSREVLHFEDLEDLSHIELQSHLPLEKSVTQKDREQWGFLLQLFQKYPQAEPSQFFYLSRLMKGANVYLGNSLPVREWDLAADPDFAPMQMAANRGANGIDGQLSTYLGWTAADADNWCIVGDLTAMYDLTSLWITSQMEEKNIRIVVMNNNGGMIFKRLFQKDIYLNKHEISFRPWAEMWNWEYTTWSQIPSNCSLARKQIIEVTPSAEQTEKFWNEWEASWKK